MSTPEHRQDSGLVRAHAAGRRLWPYLLPLLLCPILMLAAAFFIVPTHWFLERAGNTGLLTQGYGAHLHNANCQIVIYGDSSATVDVDPKMLEQRTGLTACNIAEFEGMYIVNKTDVLERFLRNNPAPKFIVFLFAPNDFYNHKAWKSTSTFEGITYRLTYLRNWQTAKLLAVHPESSFAFAELGLRMALLHARSKPMSAESAQARERLNGRFPLVSPTQTECFYHPGTYEPVEPEMVHDLRRQFSSASTTVLVDATPTVACDGRIAAFQQELGGLVDNAQPYPIIPLSDFVTDGQFHTNENGMKAITGMIADQIVARLSARDGETKSAASVRPEAR